VTYVLAGAFGFLGALVAHDLAAQALAEQALRPLVGTCPRCGYRRGWSHLACERCGRRVGRETPLILLSVAFAVGFANTTGASWATPVFLGFLTLTLALGITDLDSLRLVDRLNLRGSALLIAALGLAALGDGALPAFGRALLGGAAYFVGTNLVFLLAGGKGFGYGDVKLSVQLGVFTAYISWGALGWSVFLTALIGGLLSISVLVSGSLARSRARRSRDGGPESSIRDAMQVELPYGPSMILGSWISIVLAGLGAFPIPT
jgi:prepilin signal peptidase PulO-like enzyme (type II secretory pathway)